jgi:predicted phosphodiesterase
MSEHKVRILHVSDLHERQGPAGKPELAAKRGGEPWRRRQVLGDAWKKNLDEIRKRGPIDLVCFTGDVADWGLAEEYAAVTDLVLEMLAVLSVPLDRFFVVPGNHDIHRPTNEAAWKALRRDLFLRRPGDCIDRLLFSRWMAALAEAPRGVDEAVLDLVLARSASYRRWVGEMLGRKDLLPETSPHGRLGYRKTLRLDGRPFDVHLVGLDSAWLSGSASDDDSDAGKLLLTENQVGRLTTGGDGSTLGGLRIALMHHPLSDLADGDQARVDLAGRVDLVLRGHLHEESLEEWVDPTQKLRLVAAGSLYEGDLGNRWPNACHMVEITADDAGRPIGYEVRFRGWSTKRAFWFDDNGLYPGTEGGVLRWGFTGAKASSLPPAPQPIFIGRTPELAALEAELLPASREARAVAVGALQGMPGVGKSYLANHFFAQHTARFPGGLVRLVLGRDDERSADELFGALADRLQMRADDRVRERLLAPPALLHIENADTEHAAGAAAGVVSRLPGCAIIVTGRFQGLGRTIGWSQVEVKPFGDADAVAQLAAEHPRARAEDRAAFARLARELGYLPLALSLAAAHLATGRSVDGFLDLLRRKRLAIASPDPASARDTIAATFALSLDLFARHLGDDATRLVPAFEALGHAPLAGFGASLGAAIAELDAGAFEGLVVEATRLSMLLPVEVTERADRAHRVHPLLAELLRDRSGAAGAFDRMTAWFVDRLPKLPAGQEDEQGKRWKEVHAEAEGLAEWLGRLDVAALARVERAGDGTRIASARSRSGWPSVSGA